MEDEQTVFVIINLFFFHLASELVWSKKHVRIAIRKYATLKASCFFLFSVIHEFVLYLNPRNIIIIIIFLVIIFILRITIIILDIIIIIPRA